MNQPQRMPNAMTPGANPAAMNGMMPVLQSSQRLSNARRNEETAMIQAVPTVQAGRRADELEQARQEKANNDLNAYMAYQVLNPNTAPMLHAMGNQDAKNDMANSMTMNAMIAQRNV